MVTEKEVGKKSQTSQFQISSAPVDIFQQQMSKPLWCPPELFCCPAAAVTPGHSPQGAELTSKVVAEEHAAALKIPT